MIRRRITAAAALLLLLAGAGAAQRQASRRVRFARGATSAVVEGAVIRGDRDRYVVAARAGQRLRLAITSLEDNAVFQLYAPGQRPLRGAGEADDARRWSGLLPRTGDYVVVVGGTRGNASYRLTVSIRP
jgi:hypothetical protein